MLKMMSHSVLSLALTLFATYVLVQSQLFDFDVPMPKPGSFSPLLPSLDDMEMCKQNANGRKFNFCFKKPLSTCRPVCVYEGNVTEQVTAVDGQLCCDTVGVGPTGLCKGGRCMMGGVADISTKKGLESGMDLMKKFG